MTSVFISYSRKDMMFARQLVISLQANHVAVWFDQNDIIGGHNWRKSIEDGITQTEVFVLIMTLNSLASDYCRQEYEYALQNNKPILPIYAAACNPNWLGLGSIHRIDFVKKDFTTAFGEVLRALQNQGSITSPAQQICPICKASGSAGSLTCVNGHVYRPSRLGQLVNLQPAELGIYVATYQPYAAVATSGMDDLLAVALPLLAMRNFDGAAAGLQQAINANPIQAYPNYALALAGLRMRRPFLLEHQEALRAQTYASNALAYDPGLAPAAFLLALIKEDFFAKHGYRVDEPGVMTCLNMARGGRIDKSELRVLLALVTAFSSPAMTALQSAAY
ncbi:MAG: toll/interleukin-1 receptor domain-containing protein [Anaerolineae bacterium]|nr:toll/interleukin-1 receptor domain-containing protein [Anaerolineae bacterium]